MNALSQMLAAWLFDFAWMATAILLAATALRFVLRDPASRVQLAWATWLSVIGMAVLVASPIWPRWEVQRLLRLRGGSPPVITAIDRPAESEPLIFIEPADLAVAPASIVAPLAPPRVQILWREWLTTIWLVAATLACGWAAIGFFQARRLIQASKPAPSWIIEESKTIITGTPPVVLMSPHLLSAVAIGALHPRILLPHSAAQPNNQQAVRAALAHEWAHIRHGDLWLLALERLLVPVLVLHPLFWWLRRCTRLEQELLADAAAAGQQPLEYAEALLAWAKTPPNSSMGLTALAMWDRPTNLSRRVHMILNAKPAQRTWQGRLGAALAAGTILVAGMALSVFTTAAQQPAAGQTANDPNVVPAQPATDTPQTSPPSTNGPTVVPTAVVPAVTALAPASSADPRVDPTTTLLPQPLATTANVSPFANNDHVLTLKLALFALNRADFQKTRKQVIESVEQLATRSMFLGGTPERPGRIKPLQLEIDSSRDSDLVMDIQSIEGVKLISRATVVAMSGQQAHLNLAEPGPQIEIDEELDGKAVRRHQQSEINYLLLCKSQPLGDGSQWNIDINVNRGQSKSQSPTTALSTMVHLGRTLVIVSSEPYALLVTPLKVEPRVTGVRPGASASIAEAKIGSAPSIQPVPALPARGTIIPASPTFVPSYGPRTFETGPTLGSHLAPTMAPVNPGFQITVEPPRTGHPATVITTASMPTNAAERQLLELDLTEAKLDVQLAETEFAELEEIRKKNPGAASLRELRKRQLQLERAKIQVRRIEIRLDSTKAPAETTPPPTPAKGI